MKRRVSCIHLCSSLPEQPDRELVPEVAVLFRGIVSYPEISQLKTVKTVWCIISLFENICVGIQQSRVPKPV